MELVQGDCREMLRGMADASVDLVLTDPPYSDKTHVGARGTRAGGRAVPLIDFEAWDLDRLRAVFGEAGRVARRWVVSFMDYRHIVAFEQEPPAGLDFVRFGVWVKPNAMRQLTADRPAMGWEGIAFLHKQGVRKRWHGGGRHAVFEHLTANSGRFGAGYHPAEKPVGLLTELMRLFSEPGDLVLDPFMGSGTTGVACVQAGRKFVGCEIDPAYFAAAQERIAREGQQPRLFAERALSHGLEQEALFQEKEQAYA